MTGENPLSLHEIYNIFSDEVDELNKKIKENLIHISEIDEYLDSIYAKEDEDFKVFSPRNVESVYKDDIAVHRAEKNKLEKDNRYLYNRLNRANALIAGLKNAMAERSVERRLEVLDIQEKERQRIARDLHDTSLQNLTHLTHEIELASLYLDKDVLQAKLELTAVNKNLRSVIDEIRNTIFDLRPMSFDDLGLRETFERLFCRLKESYDSFDFETKIANIDCDNNIVLMTIYRVVQEACVNALKHSGGNKLTVALSHQNNICDILVKDNGSGFSEEEVSKSNDRHFGIAIMKERVNLLAGTIRFVIEEGEGTEVRISIPLV